MFATSPGWRACCSRTGCDGTRNAFGLVAPSQKYVLVLLTNERPLRKLATVLGVTAHGSLWVIRTLVDRGFIDPPAGLMAMSALCEANPRLPEAECTRLRRDLELRSSRGPG